MKTIHFSLFWEVNSTQILNNRKINSELVGINTIDGEKANKQLDKRITNQLKGLVF